jgi:hypothetical protein
MTTLSIVIFVLAGVVVITSLVGGIARYRAVMRRNWPKLPPAEGDDEDW